MSESEHKEGNEDNVNHESADLNHELSDEAEKDKENGKSAKVVLEDEVQMEELDPDELVKMKDKENGKSAKVVLEDEVQMEELDPDELVKMKVIENTEPSTELEIAMSEILKRKEHHIARLTQEITKLKAFISKRKQTYKRKRKDEGAPTRALSAYNIFVQERFARLAKDNENALKSDDADAKLKRVPPANLVASTGNEWKELTAQDKEKYEEQAKGDRTRYEKQMALYQPPDKQANRKRNKTGYNMFFSAHVLRLKNSESGVPSERGSVARLVGTAWKQLTPEEKQFYEREADKHNGMNPVREGEEEDEDEEAKRQAMAMEQYHMHPAHQEMHMHPAAMPPPIHGGMHQPPQHDPRQHHPAYYPPHMYAQPAYPHYDYSQHHQRHSQSRSQGYQQNYGPPQQQRYDSAGMPI